MGHDHGHSHSHGHHGHGHHHIDPEAGDRKVAAAIVVNLLLTVAQIIGGVVSGSLALIADAIHNLSDAMSLVIAFAARKVARRGADQVMTFGYDRAEVVAALINYTTLILVAFYLAAEGVMRLIDPPGVEGWIVVIVAAIALVIDTATALLTFKLSKESMNIRAAFLHNVADALGSVAVIFAGTLILIYDWRLIDPIVTLGISAYILWHAAVEIRPVIRLLMLGSPMGIENEAVRGVIGAAEGVEDVHHLHLWQIDERRVSVEAHVVVSGERLGEGPAILKRIKTALAEEMGIRHSTIQLETPGGCADR